MNTRATGLASNPSGGVSLWKVHRSRTIKVFDKRPGMNLTGRTLKTTATIRVNQSLCAMRAKEHQVIWVSGRMGPGSVEGVF